jgi:hypothetical protein
MAAKKQSGNSTQKDFKHYNKTFGNFPLMEWEYYCLLLICLGIIRINARRLRKS